MQDTVIDSRSIRVVAIDDDLGDLEILRRNLAMVPGWDTEFQGLTEPGDAQARLAADDVDLVFLDYMLGAETGLDVLQRLRQAGNTAPVIFLTGQGDEQIAVEAMRAGATDYVSKQSLSPSCLERAMSTAVEKHRLQRLAEEYRRQIERTNEDLARRNREIERFYHTLSHELKQPLSSAWGFLEILLEGMAGQLNETQHEFIGSVRDSCEQIQMCIDDLLDMARLDTGKFSLDREAVAVGDVVHRAVLAMRPAATAAEIALEHGALDGLPEVLVDPKRIIQVLINLLSNAIKYTPIDGRIQVDAECKAGSDLVRVTVRDSGPGIDPEKLPRIFERLFQVCETDASERKGLGLGLSICRDIVRLHGGEIAAASPPGGAVFSFTVPVSVDGGPG